MKLLIAAIAIAFASPALALAADPHSGHRSSEAPATPAQPGQAPAKRDCCAEKAKSGSDAHAEHKGH